MKGNELGALQILVRLPSAPSLTRQGNPGFNAEMRSQDVRNFLAKADLVLIAGLFTRRLCNWFFFIFARSYKRTSLALFGITCFVLLTAYSAATMQGITNISSNPLLTNMPPLISHYATSCLITLYMF